MLSEAPLALPSDSSSGRRRPTPRVASQSPRTLAKWNGNEPRTSQPLAPCGSVRLVEIELMHSFGGASPASLGGPPVWCSGRLPEDPLSCRCTVIIGCESTEVVTCALLKGYLLPRCHADSKRELGTTAGLTRTYEGLIHACFSLRFPLQLPGYVTGRCSPPARGYTQTLTATIDCRRQSFGDRLVALGSGDCLLILWLWTNRRAFVRGSSCDFHHG